MRGIGSAWWHVPLLIVVITFLVLGVYIFEPSRETIVLGVLVSAALTCVLVRRDRHIYLPRRLEAQRAGSTKRADIQWPIATLIWCAFVAMMQFMPHHNTRVGTMLLWIGLVGVACSATWQIVFPPQRFSR